MNYRDARLTPGRDRPARWLALLLGTGLRGEKAQLPEFLRTLRTPVAPAADLLQQ
ncbi:MAG: hypothetical protein KJP03_04765 [Gammaproteobacteria bacterium]|nr:hypothetical protein [Gammaproteobacteria bacterium]NNF60886.1 hypothetical protein [Gammaproteobacteria bacterium]